VFAAVALVASSCVTPSSTVGTKALAPGQHVDGRPTGLAAPQVLNRRDFVYALDFDDDSRRLAFTHHVSTNMEVTLTGLAPLVPVLQTLVNASEFDLEDVVIDGDRLLVPSRQGTLRALSAVDGHLLQEVATGEPLLRVATSSTHVFAATSTGRVLVFNRALGLVGEARVHSDEVRGLAVLDDTRLATASLDGTLQVHHLAPASDVQARVPTAALEGGERLFLAHINGANAIATVRDTRQQHTTITRAAVKRLHLMSTSGTPATLPVTTAEGAADVPATTVGALQLRTVSLGVVVAAVCDACVPAGAELALGQDVLSQLKVVEEVATDELVVRPADGATSIHAAAGSVVVVTDRTTTLPGPANDLDVNVAGTALVTFSSARAERTFAINDAEKKGQWPAPSATSGAALVDVNTGALGQRFVNNHLGFAFSGAISADGRTVVTGGWDKRVLVWDVSSASVVTERTMGWSVRRVRISPDGQTLGVAAWTPVNPLNEGDSEPALVLYPLLLQAP
jgi:WD40 repeat protein